MIWITFDSETPPIARGRLAQRPVCGQYRVNGGATVLALWRDIPFREWLESGAHLDGANIAYDLACALADDPELFPLVLQALDEGRIHDIQLARKLLDIAAGEYDHREIRGWNLQELARRIGIRIDKDTDDLTGDGSWRLRFLSLDGIPIELWPEGAVRYATEEIPATRAVRESIDKDAQAWRDQGLEVLGWHEKHAVCSAFALHLSSCHGVLTNPEYVERMHVRVEAYLAEIDRDLIAAGLVRDDADHTRDTHAAARKLVDTHAARLAQEGGFTPERLRAALVFTEGAPKKEREAVEKWHAKQAELAANPRRAKSLTKKLEEIEAQWHYGIHLPGVSVDQDQCILAGGRDHTLDPDDLTLLEKYSEHTTASLLRGRIERMRQGYVLPLQTRFDPLKATARTSSTQPQEPLVGEQMQNYPRQSGLSAAEKKREREGEFFIGLRECYRPRDGFDFIIADLEQAELHVLAELCLRLFGHSEMARLLNEGIDLHWHFAARSLGVPMDTLCVQDEHGNWKAREKKYKRDRDRAKPANFGFPGGMGPDKFILYSRKGYGVRFERDEVVELKRQWLETFPEVREYLNWISWQLNRSGGSTFTYVHPITGFVRGGCGYSDGANHGFQHPCAYAAKEGYWVATKACFTPGNPMWGSRLWNFVHDEGVGEAPCATSGAAADELGRIMAEVFNRYCPNVPTKAEGIVSRLWSKSAKPVRVNGALVPWQPEKIAA